MLMNKKMRIEQIRLANVKKIIEERFDGVQVRFCEAINRKPQQISRYIKGKTKLGGELARHIEKELDLPDGCLDSTESIDDNLDRTSAALKQYFSDFVVRPLIRWSDINSHLEGIALEDKKAYPIPGKASDKAFVLEVQNNNISTIASPGDLVGIDPEASVSIGDYVLVKVENDLPMLARYFRSSSSKALISIDTSPVQYETEDYEIIGKVLIAVKQFSY
ncbi:S24 family peptidase [Ferrimonas aestuarii]|uniref:Peptidase S24/S26A/S26B/S26C domain-containing protein n=1 Tax=Ferrimonas aestuarii TaxID=2569539 RepID=A0A4U1BQ92_9GAMM|nr:S24 family peptidase [Ferrimonas aestuarii]TKB53283.1 hypothetical protein FCL42_14520 [Ferrimonas aestuarii]